MSSTIVGGILGPRVVGRHDDEVGQACRRRAHLRPLRAVAVAAGAEHDDDPAALADAAPPAAAITSSRPSGVWAIVDDDVDRDRVSPPTVTRSNRPGTVSTLARPATIASTGVPIAAAVVAAARAFITLNAPPSGTTRRSPRQVKATVDDVTSTSVTSARLNGTISIGAASTRQPSVLVVDVDDADDGATGLEQQRLGPEVLLDRAVQVEVVAAEIGEHGGVEPRPVDAVQGQGVRRDLHHHRAVAPIADARRGGPAAPAPPGWCRRPTACR